MRVVLLHDPTAGSDHHSADQLIDEIRAAGHEVVATVQRRKELLGALERRLDLVAVGGGDGTVGKAAEILRGTGIPLAVIPLGTANNIAATLGVRGVQAWGDSEPRRYDVARAHVDGTVTRCLEVIGCGVFAWVIRRTQMIEPDEDAGGRLARDLEIWAQRVLESPLKAYELDVDGADRSGAYFLVEVLNIPSIGPRLTLAPDAAYDDGLLDLVVAGEPERAALHEAIAARARGESSSIVLPVQRARRVTISGQMRRYHHDGKLHDAPTRTITVTVEPGALTVFVPRGVRTAS